MSQSTTAAIPSGAAPVPVEVPRPRTLIQSIPAEFYNVSDSDGNPIAGLIVLNDSSRRPVRAELHLVGATTEETGRQAIRQAQHILEERYHGPEELPMQVWQSFLRSEPLQVPLPPSQKSGKAAPTGAASSASVAAAVAAPDAGKEKPMLWMWVVGAAGMMLIALLLWGVVASLWANNQQVDVTTPASGGTAALTGDAAAAAAAVIPDSELALEGTDPQAVEAADLPPSVNAHTDLLVGKRVRIMPDLMLTLRTEPGNSAGDVVGYMKDGMEAIIVGGPKQLKGDSDTIVWWEVQLDDGKQAWAAANTSKQALLELAE